MNYKESERKKVENFRQDLFKDPGQGIYKNSPRPFVLADAQKNLYHKIRKEAIDYFKDNHIVWWSGSDKPTGHLLSSQISCINHLFFLRNDKNAALKILQSINPNFIEATPDFENGYIGFEVTSNESYLKEVAPNKKQTRGANCTSVDAMMCGILDNGKKIQVLIEWKYTEAYTKTDKSEGASGDTRTSRYNELILDKDSPIKPTVSLNNFYYEPFYQLMRQTLLAWQMTKHKKAELNADDWLHIDVIPENNLHLRYKVSAPDLPQSNLTNAWKSQLKEPNKYQMLTPQKLLQALLFDKNYSGLMNYLNKRYW